MEDARFLLEVFGSETRRIGYLRNRLETSFDDMFTADNNVITSTIDLAQGEYIKGEADPTFFDRFAFRYQLNDNTELSAVNPNFTASPCTQDISLTAGEDPATENHIVTIYLFVEADPATGTGILKCRAKRDNLSDADDPVKNPVSGEKELMSNVEALRVLYGEDTDNDHWPNHYLNESQVSDWKNVVSMRLSVVLNSSERGISKADPSYSYDSNTYGVRNGGEFRVYRVFSTTISMRNVML